MNVDAIAIIVTVLLSGAGWGGLLIWKLSAATARISEFSARLDGFGARLEVVESEQTELVSRVAWVEGHAGR